jgi:hypothetical protein
LGIHILDHVLGEWGRDVYFNQRSKITNIYETQGYQPRISRYISTADGVTTSKDNTPPSTPTKPGRCRKGRKLLSTVTICGRTIGGGYHSHATPFSVDTS